MSMKPRIRRWLPAVLPVATVVAALVLAANLTLADSLNVRVPGWLLLAGAGLIAVVGGVALIVTLAMADPHQPRPEVLSIELPDRPAIRAHAHIGHPAVAASVRAVSAPTRREISR